VVKKKRSKKARISKEDEVAINKKITFGATLTLLFLILFLFTQLESQEQRPVDIDELTPQEKIDTVQKNQDEIADQTNYQRALTFQSGVYCTLIKEESLRLKCEQETPEVVQQEPVEEKSQQEVADQTNYQRALTFGNVVYCDLIGSEENHIKFDHLQHEHVHTSEDAARIRGNSLEQAAKAIVLKIKPKGKKESELIQCVLSGSKKINLKELRKTLDLKSAGLASPEEVLEKTNCTIGSVPPFGMMFGLRVFADEALFLQEKIVFSAGTHNDSIRMHSIDFKKIVKPSILKLSL